MSATDVTRANTNQAIVKRTAVFLKELRDGAYVYIRMPFDFVEYDRGHQSITGPNKTYIQLHPPITRPDTGHIAAGTAFTGNFKTSKLEEVYDDLTILDKRPDCDPTV